jgi:hypothetical protein
LSHCELLQGRTGLTDTPQVFANNASIDLTDLSTDLACFVIFDGNFVEGFVGAAFAESG